MVTYRFRRGETIALSLDILAGSSSEISGPVTCELKKLWPGRNSLSGGLERTAANFTVIYRPAVNGILEGWDLEISAAVSANLSAGKYSPLARFTGGGDYSFTDEDIVVEITP